MKIENQCSSYFREIGDFFSGKSNSKKGLSCSLKVLSLATVIIPLLVGFTYAVCLGIRHLQGRVSTSLPETNEAERINEVRERVLSTDESLVPEIQMERTRIVRENSELTVSSRTPTKEEKEIDFKSLAKTFIEAIQSENFPHVRSLLNNQQLVNYRDHNGFNALFFAKSPEMLKLLLENGVDPNQEAYYCCKNTTPLIKHCNKTEFVKLLLKQGARREACEKGGWTALMHARLYLSKQGYPNYWPGQNNNGEDQHMNIWHLKYYKAED